MGFLAIALSPWLSTTVLCFFPELFYLFIFRTDKMKPKKEKTPQPSGMMGFLIFGHFPSVIPTSIIDEGSLNFMSWELFRTNFFYVCIASRLVFV